MVGMVDVLVKMSKRKYKWMKNGDLKISYAIKIGDTVMKNHVYAQTTSGSGVFKTHHSMREVWKLGLMHRESGNRTKIGIIR